MQENKSLTIQIILYSKNISIDNVHLTGKKYKITIRKKNFDPFAVGQSLRYGTSTSESVQYEAAIANCIWINDVTTDGKGGAQIIATEKSVVIGIYEDKNNMVNAKNCKNGVAEVAKYLVQVGL